MPSLWFRLGKLTRRAVAPLMAWGEVSRIYGRPHCRWPFIHKTKWGGDLVICGEQPIDSANVNSVLEIGNVLTGGREAAQLPSSGPWGYPFGDLTLLPRLLEATADHNGDIPICRAHRARLATLIEEAFALAAPEDQARFRQRLNEFPPDPYRP